MGDTRLNERRWFGGAGTVALLLFGFATASGSAPAAGPTPYPERIEEWPGRGEVRVFPWMIENREYFWKQRQASRDAIVLSGDSLLAGWKEPETDLPGLKIVNRGIGGDTSRGLLFRFEEDVLDIDPRAIVILIGTNDLSARQAPADIAFNVARLIEAAREQRPAVPIVLCTLPPRAHPDAMIETAKLVELNAALKQLAGAYSIALLDLYPLLGDGRSAPVPEYFQPDRMHIAPAGYRRFARELREHLTGIGIQQAVLR